jgi:hypothetical protein
MDFDAGAVQAYCFHADTNNILLLKSLKKTLQNAIFAPPVHARINGMPIPILLRQRSPFAAVFRDIQYRIHQLKIRHAHIASLPRQVFRYFFVLFLIDFHANNIASIQNLSNSVNRIQEQSESNQHCGLRGSQVEKRYRQAQD